MMWWFNSHKMPRQAALWAGMAALLMMFATPAQAQSNPIGNVIGNVTGVISNAANAITNSNAVNAATAAAANENCTHIQDNKTAAYNSDEPGLLSEIYLYIKNIVGAATQNLFEAFTNDTGYQQAVGGAILLMVVFYGIAFTIGVVQASFADVLVRLIKLMIIVMVISPGGWDFFSSVVVKFFMDGTDELVKGVIEIGLGNTGSIPADATPFFELDKTARFLVQPDTITQILGATFAGGPYGMAMSGLLGIASWGFLKMLITALRVYASTFVARALLLGIAPVFIVFLLFDRTKQLFMSWLQALISLSLQPILMFIFLSFFMVMIDNAAKNMMSAELCWGTYSNVQGSGSPVSFWRFKDPDTGATSTSQLSWEGSISCLLKGHQDDGSDCPEFPLNIVDILTFVILIYIAERFMGVITRIANELSNTFISLDAGGKLDQFLSRASGSFFGGK